MTARIRWGLTVGAVLVLAAGCTRSDAEADDTRHTADATRAASTPVDRAVAVARALHANPAATDSILSAHGLNRAGFDALMYDIASDSAWARAYAEAIR
ncbi:MAG: hypothetical protein WD043_11315 [Gemmatimonadales bacterium]